MRFFNERVDVYTSRGALIGALVSSVSTVALFIALDNMLAKNLQGEQTAGLARVVIAMAGMICSLCAVPIGFACGAFIGAITATSYNAICRNNQDNQSPGEDDLSGAISTPYSSI